MLWAGFTKLTASAKIADGPLLFFGVTWNAGSTGQGVQLYSNVQENGPDMFADLEAGNNLTGDWSPPHPVYCERGLYVKFDGNTDDAVIFWRALPEEIEGQFGRHV